MPPVHEHGEAIHSELVAALTSLQQDDDNSGGNEEVEPRPETSQIATIANRSTHEE